MQSIEFIHEQQQSNTKYYNILISKQEIYLGRKLSIENINKQINEIKIYSLVSLNNRSQALKLSKIIKRFWYRECCLWNGEYISDREVAHGSTRTFEYFYQLCLILNSYILKILKKVMASSNIGNPTFNYDVNARATAPQVNTNPTYSNGYDVTGNRASNVRQTDPDARLVFNYSNSPNQVNVPVTGTTSSNFAPGAIAAQTLNRYTVPPPTGNVQGAGNYSTYNSYNNPININTAATGQNALTTHITTSSYNAQPGNVINTTTQYNAIRSSTDKNAFRESQQNYENRVYGASPGANQRNLEGGSSVGASAGNTGSTGSNNCNWKVLGLIGLGFLLVAGIVSLILLLSGDSKNDAFAPDNSDTTVTTETTVVDNSTSPNKTTTDTTYPTFQNLLNPSSATKNTTNATASPNTTTANTTAPTTAGQTISYPTNSTNGTTSVTNNGTTSGTTNGTTSGSTSGTTSGTTAVSTATPTAPTSGTTVIGTKTAVQTTPTYTLVIPKHSLLRKYVD